MKAMSPSGILKDNFLINGTLVAANRVRRYKSSIIIQLILLEHMYPVGTILQSFRLANEVRRYE